MTDNEIIAAMKVARGKAIDRWLLEKRDDPDAPYPETDQAALRAALEAAGYDPKNWPLDSGRVNILRKLHRAALETDV